MVFITLWELKRMIQKKKEIERGLRKDSSIETIKRCIKETSQKETAKFLEISQGQISKMIRKRKPDPKKE